MADGAGLDTAFLSRSGRAARLLAGSLLGKAPGERLPPIADLAAEYHVGVGTVQRAVDILLSTGAVTLEPRGVLGTFITTVDVEALWQLAGHSYVTGSMPLPYLREHEGLATALRAAWTLPGVKLHLSFVRGAANRLEIAAGKADEFAIASRFAAEAAIADGLSLKVAVDFGRGSYGNGHVVLFAPGCGPRVVDGYRVGVDPSSYDQVALTRQECAGIGVRFVELGYMQLLDALAAGRIQAAVWDAGEIHGTRPAIERQPLSSPEALELEKAVTTAVLVVAENDDGLGRLVAEAVDPKRVRRLQREVVSGRRMPSY
jgi:hypothetical protein